MDFYGAEISFEQFKVVIMSSSRESFKLANVVSKKFYPNHTSILKTKSILCVNSFCETANQKVKLRRSRQPTQLHP
jgi:hypothetical protein